MNKATKISTILHLLFYVFTMNNAHIGAYGSGPDEDTHDATQPENKNIDLSDGENLHTELRHGQAEPEGSNLQTDDSIYTSTPEQPSDVSGSPKVDDTESDYAVKAGQSDSVNANYDPTNDFTLGSAPEIKIECDNNLEYGVVNYFPLTKLMKFYIMYEKELENVIISQKLTSSSIAEPFCKKLIELTTCLLKQIEFNMDRIDSYRAHLNRIIDENNTTIDEFPISADFIKARVSAFHGFFIIGERTWKLLNLAKNQTTILRRVTSILSSRLLKTSASSLYRTINLEHLLLPSSNFTLDISSLAHLKKELDDTVAKKYLLKIIYDAYNRAVDFENNFKTFSSFLRISKQVLSDTDKEHFHKVAYDLIIDFEQLIRVRNLGNCLKSTLGEEGNDENGSP